MTELVHVQEHQGRDGARIGQLTLNSERSLNALSLPMVERLYRQLLAWQSRDDIQCVLLDGAGDKAFCAGGDIRAMYDACVAHPGERVEEVEQFFTAEYRLDHLIHVYPKPIVLWGSGIVMGGGLGLMAGASHRVVTETSRIAMPEISIGLFPDVGGTWFLNRMPGQCGRFLGLSGYQMNGADARYVGLADYGVASQRRGQLLSDLCQLDWSGAEAHQVLDGLLQRYQDEDLPQLPDSVLQANQADIDALMAGDEVAEVVTRMSRLDSDQKWLSRAAATLAVGSPITMHLLWHQLQQGQNLSLEQVFEKELVMAVRCAELGDFVEGVRALLIDKDRQPKWRFASVDEVPAAHIDAMVTPPWRDHPLQNWNKE
ncbi:enoyl-CoA hydratase/isomerase family protein [Ferrimonas sp. SCSIO 43195]|uniref:enoyl-CoA hydratase/isomerase family protein n=1 Tax=Ferrimonas sp. SCSIO 43195 TaxID=2822844 RepID=UPI002075F9F2|nr:enoyl-CoA hydratase/isomerase family protein [Ferrimonas sp. SCSIO 43195]USD36715.1 enoyl-CoA hydratase/isomerase family protein [Ferrimonas sp. SCSIO 43195]